MTEIRGALAQAVRDVTGSPPSAQTLDVLSAQVSLETASGRAMYNFNFAGIKGAGPGGLTAEYNTHEVLSGHDVTMKQGFRAYSSLSEGAHDYISVLRGRFPQAFNLAVAGNVDGFAHALKQAHYYTADEGQYAQGLRAAGGIRATKDIPPAPTASTATGLATSSELSRVLDMIASTASRIADPVPKE
ncbi:MAG: glucosaminidase domain-containing protein [Polyangiaceae bacterium]